MRQYVYFNKRKHRNENIKRTFRIYLSKIIINCTVFCNNNETITPHEIVRDGVMQPNRNTHFV